MYRYRERCHEDVWLLCSVNVPSYTQGFSVATSPQPPYTYRPYNTAILSTVLLWCLQIQGRGTPNLPNFSQQQTSYGYRTPLVHARGPTVFLTRVGYGRLGFFFEAEHVYQAVLQNLFSIVQYHLVHIALLGNTDRPATHVWLCSLQDLLYTSTSPSGYKS